MGKEARETFGHDYEALTPDGRFWITSTKGGAEIRAVPSRALAGTVPMTVFEPRAESESQALVCFSEEARAYAAFDWSRRDRIVVGAVGGEHRSVKGPRLWVESSLKEVLVTPTGGVYVANNLNFDWKREWFSAAPRDGALKRTALPTGWLDPAILPNGQILGIEDLSTKDIARYALSVFDGAKGKRIRELGPVPNGDSLALSPDGQRLVYQLDGEKLGVVDLSGNILDGSASPSAEAWTPRVKTVKTSDRGRLVGVVDASRAIFRNENGVFQVIDLSSGISAPASVAAILPGKAEIRGARLRVALADHVVILDLAGGGIAHGKPGTTIEPDTKAPRPQPNTQKRPLPPCWDDYVMGESGALLYRCKNDFWRDFPDTQAPAARLGEIPGVPAIARLASWDEQSGMFVLVGRDKDELFVAQPVEHRLEALHIKLMPGGTGGMAIDSEGYYDFFGEVSGAFRAAATCAGSLPIDACASMYEARGLIQRYFAKDFSYRGP